MTTKEINEYLLRAFSIDMKPMKVAGDYIGTQILFDWAVVVWHFAKERRLEIIAITPAPYAEKSIYEVEKMLEQKLAECEQVANVRRCAHTKIDVWFK